MAAASFRPALVLMAGRAAGFAVTFLIPVALVRVFDQAEFGTYKQIFLIYSTLYGIAQFGMAESLFYFIPSNPKSASRYVWNSALMLAAAGLATGAGLVLFSGPLSRRLNNPELTALLPLLGLYMLLIISSVLLEIVMISQKRYTTAALTYAMTEFARALAFLAPVFLFGSVRWLMYGALAFGVVRFLWAVVYIARQYGGKPRLDMPVLKSQLAYAGPFQLALMVEAAYVYVHQYFVSGRFDAATFAIYSVGILQIPVVDLISTPASNVMMVSMTEKRRERDSEAVLGIWHDTARKLALIFFPIAAFLAVSAHDVITFLFTSQYAAAVPLFALWSTTICFNALQIDAVLRVFAATRLLLGLNLLRLCVILISIHWLVSEFHLMGAALAAVAGLAASRTAGLIATRKLLGVTFGALLPWGQFARIIAAAVLPVAAVAVLQPPLAPPHPLIRLVATGVVYSALYGALLFKLSVLAYHERLAISRWIPGIFVPAKPGELAKRGE